MMGGVSLPSAAGGQAHVSPPAIMRAVVFDGVGEPLRLEQRPVPTAGPGQLLLRVLACGVCRTDLHLIDGEVHVEHPPRILGHQIVAVVEGTERRVGVPWVGWTCGVCEQCLSGHENLCPNARFTGCDIDGGMAQYTVADERFCFPLPAGDPAAPQAPLLCAGLIGFRSLRFCGDAHRIGFYGFGAAAHILIQLACWQGREVYAFTRPGDTVAQEFALGLGATWAGPSDVMPPLALDAAIIFAPDGGLVPLALRAVGPGGRVVCGGIHMSDIPSIPYQDLWGERSIHSVANLTREDGHEFLELAPQVPVTTRITTYRLEQANEALADLRAGRFSGSGVLVP
jgi:propanol-preferring alcohol dehydrogenase